MEQKIIKQLWLLLAFVGLRAGAQKSNEEPANAYRTPCSAHFEKQKLPGENNESNVQQFLKDYLPNLKSTNSSVHLAYRKKSLSGIHYSFYQTYRGIEIYQSEIKVNTGNKGFVCSVFDNSYATDNWELAVENATPHSVIAFADGQPVLAERKIEGFFETLTIGRQVLYQRDLRTYFAASDSLVWGKIFNPDPLTTAQQDYGGIYTDRSDSNATWLDSQQQTVSFSAEFDGSKFHLSNKYIQLREFDPPVFPPVTPAVNQFFYNRSESGFEDVNAFYHLNTYRQYTHDLGFDLADDSIEIDTHAFGGDDQSAFVSSYHPLRIYFGTGGVDDAEDADVLIHEYAHFLSYNAAPGSNIGGERNSIDEGFGDYAAASYSKAISLYHSDWVFNWDGHNEYWAGRVVNSTKTYPADLVSSIYKNAEIWSSALMAIHDEIGRHATDSLLFEALYSYAANMTMTNAAQLLLDADSALNHGAYHCRIFKHLWERGLLPIESNNPCEINAIDPLQISSISFQQNGRSFTIVPTNGEPYSATLYALSGQKISTLINDSHSLFHYENPILQSSIYLVEIYSGGRRAVYQWCKIE